MGWLASVARTPELPKQLVQARRLGGFAAPTVTAVKTQTVVFLLDRMHPIASEKSYVHKVGHTPHPNGAQAHLGRGQRGRIHLVHLGNPCPPRSLLRRKARAQASLVPIK